MKTYIEKKKDLMVMKCNLTETILNHWRNNLVRVLSTPSHKFLLKVDDVNKKFTTKINDVDRVFSIEGFTEDEFILLREYRSDDKDDYYWMCRYEYAQLLLNRFNHKIKYTKTVDKKTKTKISTLTEINKEYTPSQLYLPNKFRKSPKRPIKKIETEEDKTIMNFLFEDDDIDIIDKTDDVGTLDLGDENLKRLIKMNTLKKPLVCLDIETTGLDIQKDKIIEIYLLKKNLDGSYQEYYSRFNPYPVKIIDDAFNKHGITQNDLNNEPFFKDKIHEVLDFIKDCDLVGYNLLRFDLPIIIDECLRNGVYFNHRGYKIYDSYLIWMYFEKRSLSDAVNRFLDENIENYHTARSDVENTIRVFEKQIELYTDNNIDKIDEIFNSSKKIDFNGTFKLNENMDIIFGNGKYENHKVKDIIKSDIGYLNWLIEKSAQPKETKTIAKKLVSKYTNNG